MGKKQMMEEQKTISYGKLVFEALPEAWSFRIITSLGLAVISKAIVWMMTSVAETSDGALTTANAKDLLLGWRAPVLLLLGILLVFCYIAVELLANIYLSDDIIEGRRSSIIHELGMGVRSLKRFATPSGMLVVLFIFIAVPLTGIGFSISLTKSFQIPNFIMDVVLANRIYAIGYLIALLFFVWVAYRYCFTLHAVLLDGMSPLEGQKKSAEIMKKHGKRILFAFIKLYLILALIQISAFLLFCYLPGRLVERMGHDLPHDYIIHAADIAETGTLFFGGIGNVANLNCDLLIMVEEMATENRICQVHNAGKQAVVWTVNTEEAMHSFLDSDINAVITDEIELAESVQKELDGRTEYEVLEAQLKDTWK